MKYLITLSDEQLVHLYMDGNSAALSTLVLRHRSKLYTSIYLLVKDRYLAEDMFQDVFIRVIDKLEKGQYTEEGKFLPWIMPVGLHCWSTMPAPFCVRIKPPENCSAPRWKAQRHY